MRDFLRRRPVIVTLFMLFVIGYLMLYFSDIIAGWFGGSVTPPGPGKMSFGEKVALTGAVMVGASVALIAVALVNPIVAVVVVAAVAFAVGYSFYKIWKPSKKVE